jgi:hypothetical protein
MDMNRYWSLGTLFFLLSICELELFKLSNIFSIRTQYVQASELSLVDERE